MARLTVEDCLKNIKNRFELITVTAKRARTLARGGEARVSWDNDKPTVVALREVAAGVLQADHDAPQLDAKTIAEQAFASPVPAMEETVNDQPQLSPDTESDKNT